MGFAQEYMNNDIPKTISLRTMKLLSTMAPNSARVDFVSASNQESAERICSVLHPEPYLCGTPKFSAGCYLNMLLQFIASSLRQCGNGNVGY